MSKGRYNGGGGASAKGWEPEDDDTLRRLRAEGLSCAEIGRRIDRSSDSVIGRANRLGLGVPLREWTDEELDTLRKLWADESVSRAEIGRRLNRSRDSIVNKARRLGLPEGAFKPAASVGRQVEPLAEPDEVSATCDVVGIERIPLLAISIPPARSCQWPLWGVRRPEERPAFCGEPVKPGRPYCSEHCAHAYRPVPPRSQNKVFVW